MSAFKSGRDLVEDLPRSGRSLTSSTEININKMKEMDGKSSFRFERDSR